MLIRLASDLHLEFGMSDYNAMLPPLPEDLNTVLVVAGDIHVGSQACDDFLPEMCSRFDRVIYVLGNHEFYHNDLAKVANEVMSEMDMVKNFILLDDDFVVLHGVRFVGSTLWTNVARRNPTLMVAIAQSMMDYVCIKNNGVPLLVTDTIEMNEEAQEFIEAVLEEPFGGPTVVVTHHLPSFQSVHEMYRRGSSLILNSAFYSDLDHILNKYNVAYWLHGHTHQSVPDYEFSGTKVRMNPRGYSKNPENLLYNPEFRIEV